MTNINTKTVYWTKDRVLDEARKYATLAAWRRDGSAAAYNAARKNGWLDACVAHMPKAQLAGYWTKDRLRAWVARSEKLAS